MSSIATVYVLRTGCSQEEFVGVFATVDAAKQWANETPNRFGGRRFRWVEECCGWKTKPYRYVITSEPVIA